VGLEWIFRLNLQPGNGFLSEHAMSPQHILDFWFAPRVRPLWFKSTDEFDQEVRDRFQGVYEQARQRQLDHWAESAEGMVALVIVLDQFPRNMFRGKPECYAAESQAREIAERAIAAEMDTHLPREQKAFLYLPYMHSEALPDQDKSVHLFQRAGLTNNLSYALGHREIIRRFGRFPHRNRILGRENTAEELIYLNSGDAFTG
jgi:uncharacterized protein (DUF924 family)